MSNKSEDYSLAKSFAILVAMKRYTPFLSGMILFLVVMGCLTACGKVTQEVDKKETKKARSFTIDYSASILPTTTIVTPKLPSIRLSTHNIFTLGHDDIYTTVYAIKPRKGLHRLSWGRADLASEEITVSDDVTLSYSAKAFNRYGVTLKNAQLSESYIRLNKTSTNNYKWLVKSTKLKYDYPGYVVMLFSDKQHYKLFAVDERQATKNTQYNHGEVTLYDTLIGLIYLNSLKQVNYMPDKCVSLYTIKELMTPSVFETLSYTLPLNMAKK